MIDRWRRAWVVEIRQLERRLFFFGLELDTGQTAQNTADLLWIPVVVNVVGPVIVLCQGLAIVNSCTQAADQDIRRRNTLLLHQRQG